MAFRIRKRWLVRGLVILPFLALSLPLLVFGASVSEQDACNPFSEPPKAQVVQGVTYTPVAPSPTYIKISTQIPGVTYPGKDSNGQTIYVVKDFGCFMVGIYKYFAGVAGILATVMMMYGGYKYVFSFGNQQKFSDAQDTIVSAMVGLALTIGSYIILYTINPQLVSFQNLSVPSVPQSLQEIAGWEGFIFCQGKADLAAQPAWTCGQLREDCTPVALPPEKTTICVGTKEGGKATIKPVADLPVSFNSAADNYRGNSDYECGTIVYKDPSTITKILVGGKLRDIGTKCLSAKQGCIIFPDDGYAIFTENALGRGDTNVIGSFKNYLCI